MSLASLLATPPTRNNRGRSVLDTWYDGLPDDDKAAVLAAVRNPDWRHIDLQAALTAEGAPEVADTTFGTWRRKMGAGQ